MSKHTPGPWTWVAEGKSGDMPALTGADGVEICDFGDGAQYYPSCGRSPEDPDARLIAAAPDLLEALEDLAVGVNMLRDDKTGLLPMGFNEPYKRAVAVLRKAKGAA